MKSEDALHCYCSSHGGFVQTSSSTLRDFNGIQETTHSSYDSRTGQQQSLHSRQLPDRVRSNILSYEIVLHFASSLAELSLSLLVISTSVDLAHIQHSAIGVCMYYLQQCLMACKSARLYSTSFEETCIS